MRTNRPINTAIRGKRLLTREPIDASSWAFMKMLRENDDTQKFYAVDPYAEVYRVRENIWAILTISADGMGDSWMYLINGPEKAFLIDTSFGIGDLKGLVGTLVGDKPLFVANTHCSYDHSYGNCQFDRCYCHENEAPYMELKQDPHIWDYLFDENGNGIWLDFDRADIIPFRKYEVVGVPDGYTFDLGNGYEIELVWVPGHKPGHAMFLDKHSRLLFAGDDIISMRVGIGREGTCATVEAYRDQMAKLAARTGEFDYIFPGHFIFNLESTVVQSFLDTANAILENPENYDICQPDDKGNITYQKFVRGMGTIAYRKNNIFMRKEDAK